MSVVRPKHWTATVSIAVLAAVLIAAAYTYFHRAPKLTNADTIVLADFANNTGDPVFDGTLREGLGIQLGQSPYLSVMSEDRIQQTLRLMGQPSSVRLTSDLATFVSVPEAQRSWKARLQLSEGVTCWDYVQRAATQESSLTQSRSKQQRKKMYWMDLQSSQASSGHISPNHWPRSSGIILRSPKQLLHR